MKCTVFAVDPTSPSGCALVEGSVVDHKEWTTVEVSTLALPKVDPVEVPVSNCDPPITWKNVVNSVGTTRCVSVPGYVSKSSK